MKKLAQILPILALGLSCFPPATLENLELLTEKNLNELLKKVYCHPFEYLSKLCIRFPRASTCLSRGSEKAGKKNICAGECKTER